MRKKFTMLLASLFLVMGTAWAQKLVTSVEEGKYYTLECNSTQAHLTSRFLGEDASGLNGQSAKPTYLIFEATGGGYYVKSALTGKYLNQGAVITEGSKYAVDYSTTATTVWTIGKLADDATDVYLTIGDTKFYLNNNYDGDHKLQIVKHDAIATGNACSLWEMREHEDGYKVIESIGDNITSLDQLTDGSYVIFYNVGRQKYIYEGTHDHKLWMGTTPTTGAGHEYIFRVRKEGDKYAFMAMSGRYFSSPLDGEDVYTVGIDNNAKDEFTITAHTEDNTKWLVKSSNINKWWDAQDARFVGWQGNGTNSRYEIKPVSVVNLEHDLANFITTDENIIKWLNIKNVRSGKYATYEGESTKMTQKTDNAWSKAFFYLTGTLATDVDATVKSTVKIHNFATENLCAEFNSWTAAGTSWNIMASNGQDIHPGWAISKGTDLNNGNAWNNEGGGGSTIAYWNGTDQGSTWEFVSADYHALVSKLDGLKEELKPVIADAKTAYAEGNVTEVPVTLSATEGEDGYLYSNAAGEDNSYAGDNLGVGALIDGKDDTFLHTNYGANSTDGLDHYIRVDMGENNTIDYFSFGYKGRQNGGGNSPKTMIIEGSNDNDKYYEIATLTNLPGGNDAYASEPMGGKPYRYIRFMVTETQNGGSHAGHQFFALASFNLNKVTVKDGAAIKTLVYDNLSKSVAEAERVLASSKSTEDDINGMKGLLPTIVAGLEVKEYPFELTKNINDPVCYHIKSARSYEYGGNYYWTFENGKVTTIVPNDEYKKDVEAYWFFMENPKNGQLQLVPFIEHTKPMGYTTVGNSKDRLTNNTSASGFVGTGYIFKEDTDNSDWRADYPYALKPAEGGDNYVSNCNGKDGHYMGFWNDFNDKGTRFDLERTEIVPSAKLRDLKTALAACTDVPADHAKDEIGWYSLESYAAYSNIMTPARNAYNDATLAENIYTDVLATLTNDPATLLEMNMPQSGGFYRIKNDNGTGYLSSGTGTGKTQFVAGIGEMASSIFYYDENKKLCSYTTGLYLANSGGFVNYTETEGQAAGTDFTFAKSTEWGKLAIWFNNSSRSFYSNDAGESNAGSGTQTGQYYRFTVEEVDMTFVISELTEVATAAASLAEYEHFSDEMKTALTTAATTAATAANDLSNGAFVKDMTAEITEWNALIDLATIRKEFNDLVYSARAYADYMDRGHYTHLVYDFATLCAEIENIDLSVGENATIAQIQEAIDALEAIIAGFDIKDITAGFYYFVNYDNEVWGEYLSDDISNNGTQRILTTEVSAKNIFYYDGDKLIAYASGFGFEYGICNTGTPEKMNYFEFGMAYEPGKYTVKSTIGTSLVGWADNQYWTNNNGELDKTGNAADASGWDIQAVASLPVTVGAAGWGTFYTPVPVTIPSTVVAYTIDGVSGVRANLVEVTGVVPANTGLILEGVGTHNFAIATATDVPQNFKKGDLQGSVAKTYVAKEDGTIHYVLAKPAAEEGEAENPVGLYRAAYDKNESNAFLNGACKVYLPVIATESQAPAMFSFGRSGEGTTSIEDAELTNDNGQLTIYDLTGRRIEKIVEKGIYIVNGKKVVIK